MLSNLVSFPLWVTVPWWDEGYLFTIPFVWFIQERLFSTVPPPFKETHRQTIAKPSMSQAQNFGVSETLTLFLRKRAQQNFGFFSRLDVGCWLFQLKKERLKNRSDPMGWAIHRSVAGSFGFAFLWQSATFSANVWVGSFWYYNLSPCAYGWRCWIPGKCGVCDTWYILCWLQFEEILQLLIDIL